MASITESSAADWDTSQAPSANIDDETWHETVASLDHSADAVLHKGQSYTNPYKSADLLTYYPMSEASGTTMVEAPGVPTANGDGTYTSVTLQEGSLLGVGATGFDGVASEGSYPVPIADPYSGGLTISVWVYMDTIDATADQTIMANFSSDQEPFWLENGSTGEWEASLSTGGNFLTAVSPSAGQWYHIVITHPDQNTNPGDNDLLYVDATQQDSVSSDSITTADANEAVGWNGTGEYSDCKLADVQWWGVEFTAAEVQELHDLYATASAHWTDVKSV